ncbi:hypothetical protein Goklo_007947 [Gossypium klotzschianum]|uniref:DUF4283 domain-containing protein n=1 Tax=Gossypium klotzschianum TaxID=34286 RepID=A0A7J8UY88_9ROSI|nr:hypothetical protein [Gossypium klotzschianum]
METEFARLMFNEEEEAVLQIQVEPNTEKGGGGFSTGVQIWDLGEKRFLFQFFHVMDLERVLKGSPWTFNNHLLVLYKLQWREDLLKVPLILTPFWVQIHDVPIDFFSENLAMQLGNFIRNFIDWDLSLWVQSRRALAMNSAWLREEGEGELSGNREGSGVPGNNLWDLGKKVGYSKAIDPILGFNLEWRSSSLCHWRENSLAGQAQTAMDHDLEDGVLIKEEGKKRARGRLKN